MSERAGPGIIIPAYNEERRIQGTLEALARQENVPDGSHIYVVDNGSTDTTPKVVFDFQREYGARYITLLEESEKGTGAASDTGFRHAISKGHELLLRTDADTQPEPDWVRTAVDHFAGRPKSQLLGGVSLALQGGAERRRTSDRMARLGFIVTKAAIAFTEREPALLRMAVGHNMATRARAYEAVGGMPRTSIAETNEDVDYTLAVIGHFERGALGFDKDFVVRTSLRRAQALGSAAEILRYYTRPSERIDDATIDVR